MVAVNVEELFLKNQEREQELRTLLKTKSSESRDVSDRCMSEWLRMFLFPLLEFNNEDESFFSMFRFLCVSPEEIKVYVRS